MQISLSKNVRHFLGDDNDVNAQIKETLKSSQKEASIFDIE